MRTQRSAHTLTLYIIIDNDGFITCKKFVTMRRFNFPFLSFLIRASVFLTGSPTKSPEKITHVLGSVPFFSFLL